jgi:hypothetical protein
MNQTVGQIGHRQPANKLLPSSQLFILTVLHGDGTA